MHPTLRPLFLGLLLGAAPAPAEHGPQPPLPAHYLSIDDVPLKVEVADDRWEIEHGLMYRTELAGGTGMLFVYRNSARRVFWMRNTPLPLDAAFITADGRIDEVVPLEPLSERTVTSRRPARYVLEVPRGWLAAHGLGPGSRVDGLDGLGLAKRPVDIRGKTD
ncbi:MAG: DUF192 domain-containing protein [Gammaproteobacteria bacterium]|nr:DUF192 domain-containing protein [Gammaproteobacteria bacterium]